MLWQLDDSRMLDSYFIHVILTKYSPPVNCLLDYICRVKDKLQKTLKRNPIRLQIGQLSVISGHLKGQSVGKVIRRNILHVILLQTYHTVTWNYTSVTFMISKAIYGYNSFLTYYWQFLLLIYLHWHLTTNLYYCYLHSILIYITDLNRSCSLLLRLSHRNLMMNKNFRCLNYVSCTLLPVAPDSLSVYFKSTIHVRFTCAN